MTGTRAKQAAAAQQPTERMARQISLAQILPAAERVFAAQGFSGATMAAIAAAAGLPKANLHYYFRSKERLYRATLEAVLDGWLQETAEWIVPGRPPAEALAGYVRAKMAWSRARPEASRLFAGEVLRGAPYLRAYLGIELRRRVTGAAAVLEDWARAGLIRPVAPEHLFFAIWAMTQTYADFAAQVHAVLGVAGMNDGEWERAAATVTALVLRGCGLDGEGSE